MERKYDISDTVVKGIVENLEYDSIEDAEDQLNAMSELGVLYEDEMEKILEKLKEKDKEVNNDELIKDVEDYPFEVESDKKDNFFMCNECTKTLPIEDLGIYTPANVLYGGDSTERVELCKECLKEFMSKKEGQIKRSICSKIELKDVSVIRKKEGYYLRYDEKEIGPFIEKLGLVEDKKYKWVVKDDSEKSFLDLQDCINDAKKVSLEGKYVEVEQYVPERIWLARYFIGNLKGVNNEAILDLHLAYYKWANKVGLLEKTAVVQKCKEKDKDTAEDVWCVYAESGRCMGKYKTEGEAETRLKQVEMFKHMKGGKK